MTKKIVLFLVLALAVTLSVSANARDYTLRPGDVLNIQVVGFSELSFPEIIVRPDGKVAYPYVGNITVEGLTPEQVSREFTEILGKYYENPKVALNVAKFGSTRIYVLGEVNRPGLYDMEKSHNLLDAIGAANGWTKDAAKTKVFIVRKDTKGEPQRVNLLDLLKKGNTSLNYTLSEGDVVYLSENGRIDVARDIAPLVNMSWLFRHWTDSIYR